jgi:hypothetical protein
MIVIKRPEGNSSAASYLYNVVLRHKEWEKVTILVQEDEKMMNRLNEHKITFFKLDGVVNVTRVEANHKDIIANLVDSVKFFDSLLNGMLTDEQMGKLVERETELSNAISAKEKAEEVLANE